MNGAILIIAIVVILAIMVISWYISTLNFFNTTKVKIEEAESGIDVALTKRYDLLTKSLATVKGYAKHEYETLTKVVAMRKGSVSELSLEEKQALDLNMQQASKTLNVVMEQYPNLKADSNFKELQVQIGDVEEHLQAARRIFNSNVSVYNQKVVAFPSSIVANSKGLTKLSMYKAESQKREDVKIEF